MAAWFCMGPTTIELNFSVHEVFSLETAFVHARDEFNGTAGGECAGGSCASFSYCSFFPLPKKTI